MMPNKDLTPKSNFLVLAWKRAGQFYQKKLDDFTPNVAGRWIFAGLLVIIYFCRVFIAQGWYIVTYALAIYHLNLLISFITPKMDPSMNDFDDDRGPELPTTANEEFRPFVRRLPEFKFWYSIVKSTLCALVCTVFEFTNVPVFWPILLMYFITLFIITMKRQIKHMIKYRYLPFTYGKPKYQGLPDSGKEPQDCENSVKTPPGNLQEVHSLPLSTGVFLTSCKGLDLNYNLLCQNLDTTGFRHRMEEGVVDGVGWGGLVTCHPAENPYIN